MSDIIYMRSRSKVAAPAQPIKTAVLPQEEERAYEAARAKMLITSCLGILRDNSSPEEAIKFLSETLLAISGGPSQQGLTAVAIEAIAEVMERQPEMGHADVIAYLRDVAGRIRALGESNG